MAQTFTGEGVSVFVAISVKAGLAMYARHRMYPNRMWTPKKMMAKAAEITGKKFKARDYDAAIRALDTWIDVASTKALEKGEIG